MMQNNSFGKNLIRGLKEKVNKWTHNPFKEVNLSQPRLIYYKHLTPGIVRSHQLFGKSVYFSSATEFVAGLKEIFIDKVYLQKLSEHPYIIDCGANIGLSIIYMKKLYPDAEILAFEPDEQNYSLLEKNVKAGGYSNVNIRKEAVWTENTMIRFSSNGTTDSRIILHGPNMEEVPAIRLKDLLIRKVDFLKIDIEGAEFAVIKDIFDKLDLVQNLFVEYHGNFSENQQLVEMLQMISSKGFQFYFREAASVFKHPFLQPLIKPLFDIQLNIFCFRKK